MTEFTDVEVIDMENLVYIFMGFFAHMIHTSHIHIKSYIYITRPDRDSTEARISTPEYFVLTHPFHQSCHLVSSVNGSAFVLWLSQQQICALDTSK